ncbi:hypothetical protein JW911_04950 [Candidatus Peregrinibacteria bacterium]|nr:hypothetical protein [Candidatus Peregrinibacteria bacterium]
MDNIENTNENIQETVGEVSVEAPRMTFLALITRTISSLAGGIAGTLVLLIIYILSASIVSPVLMPQGEQTEVSPLFIFVLMAMIFAATLIANLISPLLISFTQRDKYKRITTTLFQVFIINVVIFLILVPIYFFSSQISYEFTSYAAGLQIAFGVLASALILEIISNYKYALLGVYSVIFAIVAGLALNILVYQFTGNATILLFIALPVLWGGVGFTYGIFIMFYHWVVETWGTDFLATSQEYSKDYGIEEQEIETMVDIEPPEDKEGVDFLRKQ